jgi:hypothetical protein
LISFQESKSSNQNALEELEKENKKFQEIDVLIEENRFVCNNCIDN